MMEIITHLSKSLEKWQWLIKNIILVIIYFIVTKPMYNFIAEIHIREPTTLFTPLDYMIPFSSFFVIFYVFTFYPLIIFTIAYFAFIKPAKFNKFFLSSMLVYIVAYTTYVIFPVAMIRPSNLPNDFLSQVMRIVYKSDTPLNCFPSLHAANSTLTAYWLSRERARYKWLFWLIAILIIISTLFVRQHVIVDEIYGFVLAYIAAIFIDFKGEKIRFLRFAREEKVPDIHMKARTISGLSIATLFTILLIIPYIP